MLDFDIIGPALLAGLLVSATHVPLGQKVLQRGIIFLDLAVAQIAGLGLIIAYAVLGEPQAWQTQLIAITAALLGVLILNYTEKRWPDIQEAIIGSSFVLASSISILLLTTHAQGSEQLKDLLVGQILWVNYSQLGFVAVLYLLIIGFWFAYAQYRSPLYFYLLFALAITTSVQLVGVYLVFASLIFPALAIRRFKSYALISGYSISFSAYLTGLLITTLLDLPAGAVIVISLALLSYTAALLKGVGDK